MLKSQKLCKISKIERHKKIWSNMTLVTFSSSRKVIHLLTVACNLIERCFSQFLKHKNDRYSRPSSRGVWPVYTCGRHETNIISLKTKLCRGSPFKIYGTWSLGPNARQAQIWQGTFWGKHIDTLLQNSVFMCQDDMIQPKRL